MFSEISDPEPTALEKGAAFIRSIVRRRPVRVGLGIGLAALGLASLGGAWAIDAARPTDCMSIAKAELSLEEIVSVKRQVDALQRDADHPALRLNGREATFILAEHFEYPVWVSVEGDRVEARLALPNNGHCYNIEFQGQVQVTEGVAKVMPSHLLIGQLNLSTIFGGRQFEVDASAVQSAAVADLLTKTRQLTVEADHIVLQIDDVASLQ